MKELTFREWVKEVGISVVAQKLGVTYFAVRKWMTNDGTPTADTIHRIIKLSKGKMTFEKIYAAGRKKTSKVI